ncbi:hypothetical protein LCGC14_1666400, partial [marine sediment metagenome]
PDDGSLVGVRAFTPKVTRLDIFLGVVPETSRVGHKDGQEETAEDPSGARANHGDRVIADALAWFLAADVKAKREVVKLDPPVGSLAWRIARREKKKEPAGRQLLHSDGWG